MDAFRTFQMYSCAIHITLQDTGGYDAATEFTAKYGWTSPYFEHILKRLSGVPMEIELIYSAEKIIRNMEP